MNQYEIDAAEKADEYCHQDSCGPEALALSFM